MKNSSGNLRKTLAGILAVSVMCANSMLPGLAVNAAAGALPGDVNADAVVDAKDATLLQSYLIRKTDTLSAAGLANADLTADGAVNALDLAALKQQLITAAPVVEMTLIHLNGSSISVEGAHATLSQNNTVVTIDASGTYYIDGTLTDGQIIVNVPDTTVDAETVKLFLNGVNITGKTAAPILVENAENTSINLVAGTTNTIQDGEVYAENTAAIYAKDDMTIKGDGALVVTANTQYGIHCNNDLKITGGNVTVNTEIEDAIRAKQSVNIKGGTIRVNSAGDGIKSTQADVSIVDGDVLIKASNDAIQAETTIDLSGGTVQAYGDRGLTGVTGVNLSGGSVCATATDAQIANLTATQPTVLLSYAAEWIKGNEIAVKSGATVVASATPTKKFDYVLLSSAQLSASAEYTVWTGGTQMKHDGNTSGSFAMSGAASAFTGVAALSGEAIEPVQAAGIYLSDSGMTLSGVGMTLTSDKIATITEPGEYNVYGDMTGGQIVVNVDKTAYPDAEVDIVFNGNKLTNTADSPIYVESCGGECSVSAKSGTVSTISDGTSYTNADADCGAIYSKDDLKIKGKGTLIVNGNQADGIVCKDDLKIWNGNVQVTAVDDCLRGKDSVKIGDPDDTDFSALQVTLKSTTGDCIKASNETDAGEGIVAINGGTVKLTAYYDGIQAVSDLTVNSGTIDIYTFTGSGNTGTTGSAGGMGGMGMDGNSNKTENSAKGMKSAGTLTVQGGTITVNSSDDALHSAGNLTVNGGDITVQSGDDGLHTDADLLVTNGKVNVTKSYEGVEGNNITVSGGEVRATASDDGFNAAGGTDSSGSVNPGGWNPGGGMSSGGNHTLTISGGYVFVNSGGDGLDSNGAINISGGTAVVSGPTSNGNSPVDCDSSVGFTGGVLMAVGATGMMSEGYPATASSYITSTSMNAAANALVSVVDQSGKVLSAFKVPKTAAGLIYCNSSTTVSSCTVYTGGTYSGTLNADGYGTGGTLTGGSQVTLGASGGGFRPF